MADLGWQPPNFPGAQIGAQRFGGSEHDQWLRRWDLTLAKSGAPLGKNQIGPPMLGGITLTTQDKDRDFRMTFKVRHAEVNTSATAEIRIYNLSRTTARDVIHEFDRVVLQAGYMQGHFGIIFAGWIKHFKIGRESAVDGYLDLFCAEGDEANLASLRKSMEGPLTGETIQREIINSLREQNPELQRGQVEKPADEVPPILFYRDVVLLSNARNMMDEWERSTWSTFYFENGKVHNLPKTHYAAGDIVVINSGTGLIGAPEQTTEGVKLDCLLNPNLHIKGRVHLDQEGFNRHYVPGGDLLNGQPGADYRVREGGIGPWMAPLTADGIYQIALIDHTGDTRGLPWYTHLLCTHQNPSDPFNERSTASDWRP